MKRAAAMLLAAVLLFALIPFAGAAFTDADKISEGHREAVEYVSAKGVISGFPDGSFKPAETLTRAQAAKILCVALEGTEKANALTKTDTGFSDVPESHWAAKFVAYCVDKGIVAGVGNGKFDPDGKLTSVAFGKMLLVAYGRAKAEDLVGSSWAATTQKALRTSGMEEGASVGNLPSTRENACCLVFNFMYEDDFNKTKPASYKETKLDFTDGSKYRLLGRARQDADGVTVDWQADGVEFTADCGGRIYLSASAKRQSKKNITRYRVIVDGVNSEPVKFDATTGSTTSIVSLRVKPGKHTVRIIKDNTVDSSFNKLLSVKLDCDPASIAPSQPRPKLLDYIGASTAAGAGILPTPNDGHSRGTQNTSTIAYTFGYLVAEALNMDIRTTVKGSLGIVARAGSPEFNLPELYEYQNRYRDGTSIANNEMSGEAEPYTFPRKADAVILMINENDGKIPSEEFTPATKAFIARIREINGANVPIAFIYYNGSKHTKDIQTILADDPALIGLGIRSNAGGSGGHANAAAHVGWADQIIPLLKPYV